MGDDTQLLIATRYRLVRLLGAGGMGEVWEGQDDLLGRAVAVKVIDLRRTSDDRHEELRSRALREARAAAKIDHPRTVRIYDVVDAGDNLYLVMELVRADHLDEVVGRDGPLDPRAAAQLGLDVLAALTAAHAAGVVHRDVKPGNVLVLPDGRVKLGDFGIATITQEPDLTATGLVVGTPRFLSPEAAQGQRVGAPADLWGLGVTLYHAVEGTTPFDRGDALPTLHAVIHEAPRPMARAGALGPVIDALLAKDPARRPAAEEARRMLEAVTANEAGTRVLPPSAATTTLAPAPPPAPPRRPARTPAPAGHRGTPLLVALAALALLAALGAVLLARSRDDDPAATEPTSTTAPATTVAGAPETTTTTTTTAVPTTTAAPAPAPDGERPDGVPGDWVRFDGPGFSIWHPDGWTARDAGSNQVDLVDPDGGYLRIGSVTPASNGGDPVAAWEEQERAFRERHPDYERIRIEETSYRDHVAAIWEYTYEGQHADNLGFVIGDTGYALNFVTDEGSWDGTAGLREAFRAAFSPG